MICHVNICSKHITDTNLHYMFLCMRLYKDKENAFYVIKNVIVSFKGNKMIHYDEFYTLVLFYYTFSICLVYLLLFIIMIEYH